MNRTVDLNLLPIAVTLYEARSVTLAAQRLGMTQPAFSKALAKLRRMVGDELFIRVGYGMVPTPRADNFVTFARDFLSGLSRQLSSRKVFEPDVSETTFTFAMTEVQELVFFPKIMKVLQLRAPHARGRSVSSPPSEVMRSLETGEIDLAIGLFPELEKHRFFKQRLIIYDPVCLLRKDHPFKKTTLTLQQYLQLRHVEVDSGHRTGRAWKQFFRKERMDRKIVATVTRYACLPSILQGSDLVATVSRPAGILFSDECKNLKTIDAPFRSTSINIYQHWHGRYQQDARNRWIRRLVSDLYSGEATYYNRGPVNGRKAAR